jgi:hypothetical protein
MRLFLDTEFNEFGGELISMALVCDDEKGCHEFYEVVAIPEKPGAFVAEHVLPKLGKDPIGAERFSTALTVFFRRMLMDGILDDYEIIADWPADFEHFANQLSLMGKENGWSVPFTCTMRLVRGDETIVPDNPHNALSDAHALRDWWLRQQAQRSFEERVARYGATAE